MKKLKIYLDTTIISYLDQPERLEKHDETHMFWNEIKTGKYDIYISDIVLVEISNCTDLNKKEILINYLSEIYYQDVEITQEIKELAQKYIDNGLIPNKYRDDALHIATATINNCDLIASWNFAHMVKYTTIQGVSRN
ncbi:MAG: PIN domain-containing protein [Oscillospiraceae bacterium]|nr:PIN domain-containing protein [Oscillospiraceae bacterium]